MLKNMSPRQHTLPYQYAAWLVLLLSISITIVIAMSVRDGVRTEAERDFSFYCDEILLKVQSRLDEHKQVLLGGAALFDASQSVERDEWRNYAQRLQLDEHFKGIQGFGFALLIPAKKKDLHISTVRSQGYPSYSIWPVGRRETYSSIIYLEPFKGRNLRAFGYDMFSEPVRHDAMSRARDLNMPILSGKVRLVQETERDVQAGTLMYVPVYKKGVSIETVAERRLALRGWAYSPFRMNDLLAGIVPENKSVRFRVYDGEVADTQTLLYDNLSQVSNDNFVLKAERTMDFNGRKWTLSFRQLTAGVGGVIDYSKAYITLGSGVFASILLFLLIRSFQNTRQNAQRIATSLTQELHDKVEAELKLNERLKLQSAALEASANAIIITDAAGVITWVNSAFVRMSGYSTDEAIGSRPETLSRSGKHGDYFYADMWKTIQAGETWHGELINRRKDGSLYDEEMTITPVLGELGEVTQYVAVKQDISARKRAEQQLRQSEERLRFVLAATGEGVWDWDIQKNQVSHNTRWCELVGLDEQAIVSDLDVFERHLHPDDKPVVMQRISAHLDEGEPYISEHRISRDDGSTIWVLDRGEVVSRDAAGKPLRMVGSISDVTDRKLAQEAQAISESNLRLILSNSPEGVLALSSTNQVTFCNDQLARMFSFQGLLSDKISTNDFIERLGSMIDLQDMAGLRRSLSTGSREGMFKIIAPKRVIQWEARELDSQELHTVLFFRDVTKDVQIDEMKSEFLATAAHELRTPMSSIYGFVELMLTRTPSEAERKEYLQIIYDQTKSLIKMLNELLDLARIEAREGKDFKFVSSDVLGVIRKALQELNLPPESHPVILEDETDSLSRIFIDEEKIKQVFINVIGNAHKYSPKGGAITINLSTESKDATDWLRIKVSDHGMGMTKDQAYRAFERFYRANTSGEIPGTGLGLSLVKEIVHIHGGSVELNSQVAAGTDVILHFPLNLQPMKGDVRYE